MMLTTRQENFAQAVAAGKTQAEAYRAAYPRSGGWKDKTVWERASRVAHSDKVAARVAELRRELQHKNLWTREDSVRKLRKIGIDSESKPTDVIAAVRALNAMLRFDAPEKADVAADARLAIQFCFGKSIGVANDG